MATSDHHVVVDGATVTTPRLLLRPWSPDDADQALAVYGTDEVMHWLSPAMGRVPDAAAMRTVIEGWLAEDLEPPQRRWALEQRKDGVVIGGAALLALPPGGEDLEIGWQLAPSVWRQGLGAEAGHAVAHFGFDSGLDELFAVVRPNNARGVATARSIGMEWVGETEKYYDLRLQVYRLRKGELDQPSLPGSPGSPGRG